MRVIAGSAKGRHLKSVLGKNTRPTTDKVKEALFNMISPYINGGFVLDLFAGTGNLGIEALSRGMDKAIFVDHQKQSIDIIRENIESCGFSNQSEVYRNDYLRGLKALTKREIAFDIVFLDPPYKEKILENIIKFLAENQLVTKGGIVVCEHDAKVQLNDQIDSFTIMKNSIYGNISISIYQNS